VNAVDFGERLSDRLNPIVVKELRQAVRGRFVPALLLVSLLIQVVFIGIFLVADQFNEGRGSADFQAGHQMFLFLHAVMLGACLLLIPLYTGVRLAMEHSGANVDLLFVTTLKPRKIVSGKLLSAAVLTAMIFSACTPFLMFTYLLRGIDLPTIAAVVAVDFAFVLLAAHVAVLLATLPGNRVFKGIFALFGVIGLLYSFIGAIFLTYELSRIGAQGLVDSLDMVAQVGCVILGVVLLMGLLFRWSTALLSPPSANVALPVRLYLLAVWLLTLGAFSLSAVQLGHEEPIVAWTALINPLFCLSMLIAVNERERWSPRVARTIPRHRLLRLPAFVLYSGAAGGVIFAAAMLGLSLGVSYGWAERALGYRGLASHLRSVADVMALLDLYTYCYALTAVLVCRWLPFKFKPVWLVALILVALGSALPYVFIFLLSDNRMWTLDSGYHWLFTSPFAAMIGVERHGWEFGFFAGAWALLVTLLNLPWFVGQIRAFRPYTGSRVPPPATVLIGDGEATITVETRKATP
jgi:hypothetical protein